LFCRDSVKIINNQKKDFLTKEEEQEVIEAILTAEKNTSEKLEFISKKQI
jgi:hypothetical protein